MDRLCKKHFRVRKCLKVWDMKSNKKIKIVDAAEKSFIEEIKQIVQTARRKAYSAINFAQVEANWLIGKRIVEQEQFGEQRAEYGQRILEIASIE